MMIDWLIAWLVFNTLSSIYQPFNGGSKQKNKKNKNQEKQQQNKQ